MFQVNPIELFTVRQALGEDPLDWGVGVLHAASQRIALRPFNDIAFRGGHVELASLYGWAYDECLGFLVAQTRGECQMINFSHLNRHSPRLMMPHEVFRQVLLSLRHCWSQAPINEISL